MEDASLNPLQEEIRALRRRIADYESLLTREDRPEAGAGLDAAKADIARLLRLLSQKDKILEAYATELERKAEKMRGIVDTMRQKDASVARSVAAQRLLEALVEGAVGGAFLLVEPGGRLAYASGPAIVLFGEVARGEGQTADLIRGVDSRLEDDLRGALTGTAGAPRAVVVAGRALIASAAPLYAGGAVEGAVVRFVSV
jgi:hypothetical protein